MMEAPRITRIKETCLYVRDLMRTRAFYEGKLGLPVIGFREGGHIFFRAGESVLLCFMAEASAMQQDVPAHFGSGELHFAFQCTKADYANLKAHLAKAGIDMEHEHHWGNGQYSLYFRDPDRHCVEIVMEGLWD